MTGTWYSAGGTPLSPGVIARVDHELLARLYTWETDNDAVDIDWQTVDPATKLAWDLGYKNPRSTHDGQPPGGA